MKCCVCSILIRLVEADGKGEWQHQMSPHDLLWSIFNLSKETHLLKGLRRHLGQFSWVPCTSHHHPTATLTEGHSVPSSIIPGLSILDPLLSSTVFLLLSLVTRNAADPEVQNRVVMTVCFQTQGLMRVTFPVQPSPSEQPRWE